MSDIVEQIRNRIHDAPMPTEHLLDEAADEIEALRVENERLRDHISEQSGHVRTRIKDGDEIGARIWRIALEDVLHENFTTLTQTKGTTDARV